MAMKMLRRIAMTPTLQSKARSFTFPAPTRGWVTNENLAASKGVGATVLENWFTESTGIRLRGGASKAATIGSSAVKAMFRFTQGGVEKLFAADATKIYNISGLNPTTPPAADVSSQNSGAYSTAQMATAGGEFLYAVNGVDLAQLYDGTGWTQITAISSPAITGVLTSVFSAVWVYRSRLFFVEGDSQNFWYLPVDSIGGAALKGSLAGVFKKGGSLLFGATWSLDAGDGVDDLCVFVSTLGEVAIYQGTDPSQSESTTADFWRIVGVYDITAPLGKNAFFSAGGDLLIATVDGIVPITEALRKDVAALSLSAVSRPIEPDWKVESRSRLAASPWELLKWPDRNMLVVSLPHTANDATQFVFVVNLQTGAWAKYTGWDIQAMALFGLGAYFGDSSGSIFSMETGGKDDTSSYLCKFSGLFNHVKSIGVHKNVTMARATFISKAPFTPLVSITTDYATAFPTAPPSVIDGDVDALWGTGVWGTSKWGDGDVANALKETTSTRWRSVSKTGFAIAPQVQVTVGNNRRPDAELVALDILYETGGTVV